MSRTMWVILIHICSLLVMMDALGHAEVEMVFPDKHGNVEITGAGGVSRIGTVTGCVEGSGKEQQEVRPTIPFSRVLIDGAFTVKIEFQQESKLVIRGDDNILPYIVTEVSDSLLTIRANRSICTKGSLVVEISTEQLKQLTADGANDITISKLKNREFSVVVDGTSDIRISGETKKFLLKVDGAGTVQAKDLHAEEAEVLIDGAGEAEVYAARKLIAEIDGAGDIRYYGNPDELKTKIDGAGDIESQ